MNTKISLGPINSTLLKQKKKREKIEQIRSIAYKNIIGLKKKYNMSNSEFIKALKCYLDSIKI